MRKYAIHFCSFSGALGDLPKKVHGDNEAVLAALEANPRFSCFDVSTQKLGTTLERLRRSGHLEFDNAGESYPWSRARVIRNPRRATCETCGGTGKGKHLGGEHFLACQPCHGAGWIQTPEPLP